MDDSTFQQIAEPLSPILNNIWRRMQERRQEEEQRAAKLAKDQNSKRAA